MTKSVFAYPGGKTYLAEWILDYLPDHTCYVEPFAGSASVLLTKSPSTVEVLNDRDGDIVQFFETLRERGDELREWCKNVSYARDLHERWARQYYDGEREENPIDRAGRFFYLRHTQFGAKYRTKSGFSSSATRNQARKYQNNTDELEYFAERLRGVQIENQDYEEIFNRFDGPDTVFYCDPPYVKEGDVLYTGDAFDHERFVDALLELDGDFLVSYTDVPDRLGDYHIAERTVEVDQRDNGSYREATERLVLNFDPDSRPTFDNQSQSTVGDWQNGPKQ